MIINKGWLEKNNACQSGKEWFLNENILDPVEGLKNLIKKGKYEWADWLMVRVMTREQYLQYAVFATEQVLDIFEKKYPSDNRPRLAISAAVKCINDDTSENRQAANAAANATANAAANAATNAAAAAYAANAAAYAADAAAYAATNAAYAAAYAANAAANAANAAAYAAANATANAAANAATNAAAAAYAAIKIKILNYGMELLRG